MEKTKGFAHKKVVFGGVLHSRGVVIRPNGELRAPDRVIADCFQSHESQHEWTEIWDEIAADEAALCWNWRYKHHDFHVSICPETITSEMKAKASELQNEFRALHATEIDWADDELWRRNPLGDDWLSEPAEYDAATASRIITEANCHLQALPDFHGDRPLAELVQDGDEWYLQISSANANYDTRERLNRWSLPDFLRLERDYTCHAMVVQERQFMRKDYAHRYEELRSAAEAHGGQLVDAGIDGFCLLINGAAEIYALNEEDFLLFEQFCKSI